MSDLKPSFKEEINKLKKMSFKDKCWYIKEYYTIQIILIIVITLFSVSLIKSSFRKEPILKSYFVNVIMSPSEKEILINDFSNYIDIDKNDKILFDDSPKIFIDKKNENIIGQEYLLKLIALISSKDLDILVSDIKIIDYYQSMDSFFDLEEILPKELKDNLQNKFCYIENSKFAYAVDITKSNVIKKMGITEPIYLSIAKNTQNLNNSIKFLSYLFKV